MTILNETLMADRNSFIISRGFRNYFLFSLLFTVMEQLCTVVDMILVGNFVSANAFSALNLVVPIESVVTGLVMLLTGGAGIIAARQVGDQDFEGARRTITVSLVSIVALLALLSVAGLAFIDGITGFLCPERALQPYLKQYFGIYFLSLVPIALYNALILVLNIDGKPNIVLWVVIAASALDIVLDVVFMKWMKLQVRGVALSGIVSYSVPLLFMIPYVMSRRCSFRFSFPRRGSRKMLLDNMTYGLPYCSPYIAVCVIVFLVNTIVLSRLGSFALYVWGAGYQIFSLIIVTMDCIGGTILVTMGSMLAGCHDMGGFRILVSWCIKAAAIVVGAIVAFVCIFPSQALSVFGYDIPSASSMAFQRVRCIVFLGIPYAICCIKVYLSQALGRSFFSTVPLIIFFIISIGGLYLWAGVDADTMFFSFVAGGVIFIILDWVASRLYSRRMKNVSSYLLVPSQENVVSKCLSVPYTRDGLNAALVDLESFLDGCDVPPAMGINVNLCCEELMLSIVERNESKNLGDDWFFDVFIIDEADSVKVTIKDAGDPFNPVKTYHKNAAEAIESGEDAELSLRLVNQLCKDLSYNYMYGQNTIYMSFSK